MEHPWVQYHILITVKAVMFIDVGKQGSTEHFRLGIEAYKEVLSWCLFTASLYPKMFNIILQE